MENKTGIDKLKETADKLKAGTAEKEQQEIAKTEEVKSELEQLKNNSALASMYQESSKVGSENLGGETPQLKVHATGRSNNELADGAEPKDGAFFYKPTAEQFDSVDCHILTISKGFRAPGLEEGKPDVFNQLMGGVIIDNGEYKPFIMYFTGLKLSYLWEFAKLAGKYTRAKPISIPMFALTVRMTTEKIANNFGKSWIVKFDIVKNPDGGPKLVLDETIFTFLRGNVEGTEEMIAALISAKAINKDEPKEAVEVAQTREAVSEGEVSEPYSQPATEEVEIEEDLPF